VGFGQIWRSTGQNGNGGGDTQRLRNIFLKKIKKSKKKKKKKKIYTVTGVLAATSPNLVGLCDVRNAQIDLPGAREVAGGAGPRIRG
jgi:hypothetical protein